MSEYPLTLSNYNKKNQIVVVSDGPCLQCIQSPVQCPEKLRELTQQSVNHKIPVTVSHTSGK